MKYLKHIVVTLVALLVTGGVVYGTAINQVIPSDTIGTLRTTVNHIIGHVEDSTSTIGAISNLSTTTGNIIVATGTGAGGWTTLGIGSNGQVLTVTSTGNRIVWQDAAGSNFTSLAAGSGILVSSATGSITVSHALRFTQTFGQVHIASSSAAWTFTLPQTIWATSTVQFGGVTSTNVSFTTATGTRLTLQNATATNITSQNLLATSSIILVHASGTNAFKAVQRLFSVTIPSPTSTAGDYVTNNLMFGGYPSAITITEVQCLNAPSSTANSVTFNMPHSTSDPLGTGTNLFSAGQVCSNATSTHSFSTFNDATLAANEKLALKFSAASSTQTQITIFGRIDP